MKFWSKYFQFAFLGLLGLSVFFLIGAYSSGKNTTNEVLKREPVLVPSDQMRILRGENLADAYEYEFKRAEERILITTFFASDPTFSGSWMSHFKELLESAAAKGVDVRFLVAGVLEENHKFKEAYKDSPINYRTYNGDRTLHSKIIVVDDNVVFGGSANMTATAFNRESETTIKINSDKLNSSLSKYFKTLWRENDEKATVD